MTACLLSSSHTPAPSSPPPRVGVLLCNLGTPDAPTPTAVRKYLAEFLGDPRVVELPAPLWKPILHGVILPRRPRESARKYAKVWRQGEGSPLLVYTQRQAALLQQWLAQAGVGTGIQVRVGMRYGNPGIEAQLAQWQQQGVERMLLLPLYPQYSATTTASVVDLCYRWACAQRDIPELRILKHYCDDSGYLQALQQSIEAHWQAHGRPDQLVLSYHGIPQRNVDRGDPYQAQCQQTSRLLAQRLGLAQDQYRVTFQSRFGRAQWLQPYTQPTLEQMAAEGVKTVDLICPGFSSDCLETLEEINMEVREAFLAQGGQTFRYIPCLNDQPAWVAALGGLTLRELGSWLNQ